MLTKHQLRSAFDRKLRSFHQSYRSVVSVVVDIEWLGGSDGKMMRIYWFANVCSFRAIFNLQFFVSLDPIVLRIKMLNVCRQKIVTQMEGLGSSNLPRHLGIGPDQWPLAKHSRFGGPLKRYPQEHENTARPHALVFNSIKLKCGSSRKSGGHWIGMHVGAGDDQFPV